MGKRYSTSLGAARVVRELLGVVRAQLQVVGPDAVADVPVEALLAPVLVPLLRLVGRDEELHLHLLELAGAEDEVAGRDLVAEGLTDLGDAERRLLARELERVLVVEEDALGGLGTQVGDGALFLHGADVRLEHQVELARLGELAAAGRALVAAALLLEVIEAEALLALAQALDKRIAETVEVARGLPRLRMLDDRGVQGDHVVALLDHRAPPRVLDVVLEQDAVVPVVVGVPEAAVDLGSREDETSPLAEGDDLVHGHGVLGHSS